jgi:ABC-2 type transport system permease protein
VSSVAVARTPAAGGADRFRAVSGMALRHTLKRPLFWVLVVLLALMSWGLSTGSVSISSGDASVGGKKAWLTSEFNVAFVLAILVALIYGFFVAVAAGMSVIEDDEQNVSEILAATPLTPAEYVWGKFLALMAAFLGVLGLHLLMMMFWYQWVPNAAAAEIRGPFHLANYLRPALAFAAPTIVFFAGVAFYLGERFRRPILVFLFPVATLLVNGFFLWEWAPTWLDPRINRLLMLADAGGFRWLNETWLKLDRGVDFLNRSPIGFDATFLLNRLIFLGLGLLGVLLAQRHYARRADSAGGAVRRRWRAALVPVEAVAPAELLLPAGRLGAAAMREPGFWSSTLRIARGEARGLFSQVGLYLFIPLILLQTIGGNLLALGAFQTELLLTPGELAVRCFNTLTFLICALLLFYTVESIERERATGFASVLFSTPMRSGPLLLGKALANSLVGAAVVGAALVGCLVALLIQGQVRIELWPFLLVWGALLIPTFLLWTSFVTAVQALGGSRYLTYAVGLSALVFTVYRQATGRMNWVGNWALWSVLRWSDLGVFEIDRRALVLNRLLALGFAAFLWAVAVRAFRRRQPDAVGTAERISARRLSRLALGLAPYALVPAVAAILLGLAVFHGFQGGEMEKKQRDYWKQNLGTWKDAPQPSLAGVDLDLTLDPARRAFRNRGRYTLVNDRDAPLERFALTGGEHWKDVSWTFGGKPYKPEDRSGLYVFTPPAPLPPGGRVEVGFDCAGALPAGITKNGGGTSEFILPSGVVLTSFSPSFTPVVGYVPEIGIKKKENDYEPKEYTDDFYLGKTRPAFGSGTSFPTRIRITGPAAYTYNSVGTLQSDDILNGRRTVLWVSDHPVRFFNVIAGRWQARAGQGTEIFYHPAHAVNVPEMLRTLDAARRYYSLWFYPYPWRQLKLSEFPNLAGYAQGFPTDISFSEGIGFLTKGDVKTNAVFLVTAHESAHQWWGNILTPGEGPGGDILSEGMAHFATILLTEQVLGPAARIEFCKRIEETYGNARHVDAEKPLVKINGSRQGDQTVTYDKGGWVMWMLSQEMGRERALAGLREFIARYKDGPDFPVLQDLVATLRPFAADPAAFDRFVQQWYFQVVVPEYRLDRAGKRRSPGGGPWQVSVRVKNAGTGRMPVEVAAVRGERFAKKPKPGTEYREARQTIVLGAGESATVALTTPFEPERIVVDPDARVLQLARKRALARL